MGSLQPKGGVGWGEGGRETQHHATTRNNTARTLGARTLGARTLIHSQRGREEERDRLLCGASQTYVMHYYM